MSQYPTARETGLVLQEMPDELLVYDVDKNKAHCLNETSAFVWKACTGQNSVKDISRLFESQTGNSVPEDLIWLAIDQLSKNNLLETKISLDLKGQSRRDVIKKIGLASVIALPLVASLSAPSSASAAVASCVGRACSVDGDPACAPGGGCGCDPDAMMCI